RPLIRNRKQDQKSSSLIRRAFHLDGAAVAADYAPHGGKSQAAADKLGREERIEYLRAGLGVHASSAIAHLDENVSPGSDPGIAVGRHPLDPGANANLAGFRVNGLDGIRYQVHHDLLHLTTVTPNRRQLRRKI